MAKQEKTAAPALTGAAVKIAGLRLSLLRAGTALKREKTINKCIGRLEEMQLSQNPAAIGTLSKVLLKEAAALTGSALGFAGYLDPKTGLLTLHAWAGPGDKSGAAKKAGAALKSSGALLRRLLSSKKALLFNAPRSGRLAIMPSCRPAIIRLICAPAAISGNTALFIALGNAPRDYSKEDLSALRRLAAAYASALNREFFRSRLQEREENYSSILNAARDLTLTVGVDGRVKYVSERVKDYGYLPEEVLGRTPGDFIHPGDKVFVAKAIENALKTGKTLPVLPYRIKRADGSYFYAEQKNSFIFENGRPKLIIGVIRDVSWQKQMMDSLKEKDEMLSLIFDTAKDAIYVKDLAGIYRSVNKACSNLMNSTPDEMTGRSDRDYFSPALSGEISATDSQVVRRGKTVTLNADYRFPLGKKYVHVVKTPMKDPAGRIIGLLGIIRDITKLRKMESELALARAFESVGRETRPMAHDFNNALAAINGYATLIDEDLGPGNPIKQEIAMIIKGVWRASKIIARLQKYAHNPAARHKKNRSAPENIL